MKIISAYIGKSLAGYTIMAIVILTFVMISAQLFQAFDMLARGMPVSTIGRFILFVTPYMLQFTTPMAMLCATVLVFSRLSADREITAMRASGLSLWQIISPALLLAVGLSGICLYLQLSVSPEFNYRVTYMRQTETIKTPLAFLDPGRHIELPGYIFYVGDRRDDVITSVQIYELDDDGRLVRDITARRGSIAIDQQEGRIDLLLEDAMVTDLDRPDRRPLHIPMRRISFPLDYADDLEQIRVGRDIKHMGTAAILSHIHIYQQRGMRTTPLLIELHHRLAMGVSPIAFLLIGVPFGIRTRRTETSIGLLISVFLAVFFYVFVVLSKSLENRPQYYPELLVWIPNILYQTGGLLALRQIERR